MLEIADNARVWVVRCSLFAGCLSLSPVAATQSAHLVSRCARLSSEEYEELDARVLLLLEGDPRERTLPTVVCTPQASWVEWDGERFAIVGRAPLVDEVVDVIESHLHRDERQDEASSRRVEDEAVAAGQPMLERGTGDAPPPAAVGQPADRVARRPSDARGGGIALGIETELGSDTIDATVGPAFDFAASIGPVLVGGREAIRFTVGGRSVSFMDFQLLVGYGAPFDPSKRFGVVLRSGPEWMVAYPEGNSGQAAVVPVVDLGLRVAHHWGPVGVWLGLDARLRLSRLSLRSQSELIASDVGGSLTLGAAFVDWSRR